MGFIHKQRRVGLIVAGGIAGLIVGGVALYVLRAGGTERTPELPPAPPALRPILAGIERRERLVTSLRGEFTVEHVGSGDPLFARLTRQNRKQVVPPARVAYRWAFAGRRWREELRAQGGPTPQHHVIAFDGSTGYWYEPGQNRASEVPATDVADSIVLSGFGYWLDLSHNYDPRVAPLSATLRATRAHLVGKEKVGGVACYRIEAPPDEHNAAYTWWVAPDLQYLLMKQETTHGLRRPLSDGDATAVATVQVRLVEAVSQSDGVFMPKARSLTSYLLLSSGTRVRGGQQRMTVDRLEVNPELPPETFRISYPQGTRVLPVSGTPYVVAGRGDYVGRRTVSGISRLWRRMGGG